MLVSVLPAYSDRITEVSTRHVELKSQIRQQMRGIGANIADADRRSERMWASLYASPEYLAATTVMAFVSMPGEPNTAPFLRRVVDDAKTLVLPRIVGDSLEPALPGDRLVPGALRIPAPTGAAVDPASIDLVIVPGVAFSAAGGRVGHGKGYYDRFLAGLDVCTIGVCFTEQLLSDVPMEAHDRQLDTVLVA